MHTQKNQSQQGSVLTVLAVGAALGAAAVALKDKNNQKKLKTKVAQMKKWADETSIKLDTTINGSGKDAVKETSKDTIEEVKKLGEEVKE